MSTLPDLLVFLDLETTSLDFDQLQVLELGMIATTGTWPFTEIGWFAQVITPEPVLHGCPLDTWITGCPDMPDIVRTMHTGSELFDDIRYHGRPLAEVGAQAEAWLDRLPGTKLMAGSGIARFDKPILQRHLPRLLDRFDSYGELDVSSWRRGLNLLGYQAGVSAAATPHRALGDCQVRLDDWRRIARLLRPPEGGELADLGQALANAQGEAVEDYHEGDGAACAIIAAEFHTWRWQQP